MSSDIEVQSFCHKAEEPDSGFKDLTNAMRVGLLHNTMMRAHQTLANRPGFIGRMYHVCYDAMASTWNAVDFDFRMANFSDYSQIQLVWDVWVIFETLIMPRVVEKFKEWRSSAKRSAPIEMSPPQDASITQNSSSFQPGCEERKSMLEDILEKDEDEAVQIKHEIFPESSPSEDNLLFSADPNDDLPFSSGNSGMSNFCSYYNEPVAGDQELKKGQFRSSLDCLLDWSYDADQPKKKVDWSEILLSTQTSEQQELGAKDTVDDQCHPSSKEYETFKDKLFDSPWVGIKGVLGKIYEEKSASPPAKHENKTNLIGSPLDREINEQKIESTFERDKSFDREQQSEISFSEFNVAVAKSPLPNIKEKTESILDNEIVEKFIQSAEKSENNRELENQADTSKMKELDTMESQLNKLESSYHNLESKKSFCEMIFDDESDRESFNLDYDCVDEAEPNNHIITDPNALVYLSTIPEMPEKENVFEKRVWENTISESRLLDAEARQAAVECSKEEEVDISKATQNGKSQIVRQNEVEIFSDSFLSEKSHPEVNARSDSKNSVGRASSSSDSAFEESLHQPQRAVCEDLHDRSSSSIPVLEFSDEEDDEAVLTQRQWQNILRTQEENADSGHFSLTVHGVENSKSEILKDAATQKKEIFKMEDNSTKLWKTDQIDPLSLTDWTCPSIESFRDERVFGSAEIEDEIDVGRISNIGTASVVQKVDNRTSSVTANNDDQKFEERATVGNQVVEDNLWQKVIHIPIPDLSPPMSPVQGSACLCCEQDSKTGSCDHSVEDIFSDPEGDDRDDSRTGTLRSNDFSPSVGSGKRSIRGFFRRKWSQIKKNRSKLDLNQGSSDDLTVMSKWKKSTSDLTFSDSWSHTSPNSSLNGPLARSANKTWSGSTLSFFSKKKRGRLSISEFQQNETLVEADESPKITPLAKWQKSASISNLPKSTVAGLVLTTPPPPRVSISLAKSMSDIADFSEIGGLVGSAEQRKGMKWYKWKKRTAMDW